MFKLVLVEVKIVHASFDGGHLILNLLTSDVDLSRFREWNIRKGELFIKNNHLTSEVTTIQINYVQKLQQMDSKLKNNKMIRVILDHVNKQYSKFKMYQYY